MNRVCIFSHFDNDNKIDDYVLYYLKALKKFCSTIIFVSDSVISEEEQKKLYGITNYVKSIHHCEYDWGSYKRGYFIAKENNLLENCDELIFCNDSVYAPIYDLNSYIESMTNKKADICGFYQNKYGLEKNVEEPHLQSWFLLINNNVFQSQVFDEFINDITKKENKLDIIKDYEIGFSSLMRKQFKLDYLYTSDYADAVSKLPVTMVKLGFPFIKTRIFRKYYLNNYFKKLIDKDLFEIIIKHSKRTKGCSFIHRIYNNLLLFKNKNKFNIIKNL